MCSQGQFFLLCLGLVCVHVCVELGYSQCQQVYKFHLRVCVYSDISHRQCTYVYPPLLRQILALLVWIASMIWFLILKAYLRNFAMSEQSDSVITFATDMFSFLNSPKCILLVKRMWLYVGQSNRKCSSVSIALLEHKMHSLSALGFFLCLPFSISTVLFLQFLTKSVRFIRFFQVHRTKSGCQNQ